MIAVAICVVADLKSLGSQLRRVEFGQVAVALELAGHLAGRSSHRCLISIGFLWLPEWMGASSAASAFRRLCKPRPSMGSNQAGPEPCRQWVCPGRVRIPPHLPASPEHFIVRER
jgi:hypothetical protein